MLLIFLKSSKKIILTSIPVESLLFWFFGYPEVSNRTTRITTNPPNTLGTLLDVSQSPEPTPNDTNRHQSDTFRQKCPISCIRHVQNPNFMYLFTPNYPKLKTHLRLAVFKLRLIQRKQTEQSERRRKEIATLISNGKTRIARFKVEQIILEDLYVEALEIVESYCDLLLARFSWILSDAQLDNVLSEAIAGLLWVAPRLEEDIQELKVISNVLRSKYGRLYSPACGGVDSRVSGHLRRKFDQGNPSKSLVDRYMKEIARSFGVEYAGAVEDDPGMVLRSQMYTQTPYVRFSDSKTVFPVEVDEDYEEDPVLEPVFNPNLVEVRPVESLEMPEYPFDLNDIVYDVQDLQPASDAAEKLRIAREKMCDLPFSPIQPRYYGGGCSSDFGGGSKGSRPRDDLVLVMVPEEEGYEFPEVPRERDVDEELYKRLKKLKKKE